MSNGFNFEFNGDSVDVLENLFSAIGLWDGEKNNITFDNWDSVGGGS